MKFKSKLVLLPTLLATVASLGACGNKENTDALKIVYFAGGYAGTWLEESVVEFLAQEKGVDKSQIKKNVDYVLTPDSTVTNNTRKYLKGDAPDILMTQGGFKSYVKDGLIANLDSVYSSEVSYTKEDGTQGKRTVNDSIIPEIRDKFKFQMKYGRGESSAWALPWGASFESFAYNEDLLLATTHASTLPVGEDAVDKTTNKWVRVPYTTDELMAYFDDINISNQGKSETEKVVPFGWPGREMIWFDFIFNTFWAQYQGVNSSNYPGQKSWYDFWNVDRRDNWNQKGLTEAYNKLRSIITDGNGNYINSEVNESGGNNVSLEELNTRAANQKYAVWLAGDFFENETLAFTDKNKDGKPDFSIKMMYIPTATSGSRQKLAFFNSEEVMFIPQKSPHIDLAKKYLTYLCNENELMRFTKSTGTVRPFTYKPAKLEPTYNWSTWQKSIFEILDDTETQRLYCNPKNVTVDKVSPVTINEQISGYFPLTAQSFYGQLRTKTGDVVFSDIFQQTTSKFDTDWNTPTKYADYFANL